MSPHPHYPDAQPPRRRAGEQPPTPRGPDADARFAARLRQAGRDLPAEAPAGLTARVTHALLADASPCLPTPVAPIPGGRVRHAIWTLPVAACLVLGALVYLHRPTPQSAAPAAGLVATPATAPPMPAANPITLVSALVFTDRPALPDLNRLLEYSYAPALQNLPHDPAAGIRHWLPNQPSPRPDTAEGS